MSTAAVSSVSLYKELQAYFGVRHSDMRKLGTALRSGDLAAAQQQYTAIQNLGKHGPFASGDPFLNKQREQDFEKIGSELQSGNIAGAQQAFVLLQSTFSPTPAATPGVPESSSATSSATVTTAAAQGRGVNVNA